MAGAGAESMPFGKIVSQIARVGYEAAMTMFAPQETPDTGAPGDGETTEPVVDPVLDPVNTGGGDTGQIAAVDDDEVPITDLSSGRGLHIAECAGQRVEQFLFELPNYGRTAA